MEYQYPIEHHWKTEEIIDVIQFYQSIERAYEKGIEREELMKSYRRFKEIVPGKSDERNLCNDFEEMSGYSPFRTVKAAKETEAGNVVKMKK
ncbi:UPF0223 family protein [Cytobacillus gottheilii]|uniref:UPF0223 protein F7732_01475 n=2 Tax=Bacillaceae TaxID=186817 RepID=A0A7V7RPM3_9BACI|nr:MULTISPECIES: UPF0223 family protein [Bacillaceae]KAB2335264.1 UPF0223 family protein [Bacillus mesophilum]QVY63135.1 UPF0223 family protein [Cytobacillus gottheilii]